MRFVLIIKGTQHFEAGVKLSRKLIDEMKAYHESLDRAGVLLAAEGLQPSSSGIRISYPVAGGKPEVLVGPFAERDRAIAGFTLIETESEEEAIEWALRMPDPHGYGHGEIELRQLLSTVETVQDPRIRSLEADLWDQLDMLKKI